MTVSGRLNPPAVQYDLYLDWLRGLAAISVLVTHVRSGFFVQWSDLDLASHNAINYLLFLLTRLGRESVIVFFVLSGYLVGGQAWLAFRSRRYSLSEYLVARISRLWVVVIPALLLTGLLDFLNGEWSESRNGWQPFLVNLFFLQDILGNTYGSNGPFWSLSYEWWFYVLCGFALEVAARPGIVALSILAASGTLLALQCPAILLMMPLWLAGVLVRTLPVANTPKPMAVGLSLAALCAALLVSTTRLDWLGDYIVAAGVAALLYFLRTLRQPKDSGLSIGAQLAAFSFSLYALHFPLNKLLLSIVVPHRVSHAGPVEWLQCCGLAVLEISVCWLFYRVFERHTPLVRKALRGLVSDQPKSTRMPA